MMAIALPSFLAALSEQWAWQVFGLQFDVVDVVLFFAVSLFCCYIAARRTQRIRLYDSMEFAIRGFRMIGCKSRGSSKSQERRFKAYFGVEPGIAAGIWRELAFSGWLQ